MFISFHRFGPKFVYFRGFQDYQRQLVVSNLIRELKACSSGSTNLEKGKRVHESAIQSGYDSDIWVANTLIDMYGKCGSLVSARKVFDSMKFRTVVTWTALVSGYADNGEGEEALELFARMKNEGCPPNERSFVTAVKACISIAAKDHARASQSGEALHLLATSSCCVSNIFLESTLINMYAKCGCMHNARKIFDGMKFRDVVCWTAIILGYSENGESETALSLFERLKDDGCLPNPISFVVALKACGGLPPENGINRGKALHLLASASNCDSDSYVENTLMDFYAKSSNMEDARRIFDNMPSHDVVSWNALILGYAENGESEVALHLFSRMAREGCAPSARTFVYALKACTDLAIAEDKPRGGKEVHLLASSTGHDSDVYVESTLVDMYAKSGNIAYAQTVFDNMQQRNVVSWTALILGYAENGEGERALEMFSRMGRDGFAPDVIAFTSALRACTELAASEDFNMLSPKERGKALHFFAFVSGCGSDVFLENTLLDMYSKLGCMKEAQKVFDMMQKRDVISWSTLILGYADAGESELALNLFRDMRNEGCVPNSRTFVAVVKACNDLASREVGNMKASSLERTREIHLLAEINGFGSDVYVENTLVDMYAKCGSMNEALNVFEGMKYRSVVSWNALMSRYVENGEGRPVLKLFSRMKREAFEPDIITFVAVLKACSLLGALEFGKAAHSEIWSLGLLNDTVIINCLVDFYSKCGSMDDARQVFESQPTKDSVTWHALMSGYSRHGDTERVLALFDQMMCTSLQPSRITFLCVLTACSRAGLVEKGNDHFHTMVAKYGVDPDVEHYACMVDIFGRANKLDEAMTFLRRMNVDPNVVVWVTVLAACRKWKNVKLGELAFECVTSIDDKHSGAYILMANIYGSRGMWEEQAMVQAARLKLRAWKAQEAQSWWTTRSGDVHTFSISDKSHPHYERIIEKLNEVFLRMREHGYVADLSSITRNIPDAEKEDALCGHSERLALACALLNTEPGETVRIIKNLRICDDCHTATALISRLEQRTIFCRDTSRYHVFKDGLCSCGDFW